MKNINEYIPLDKSWIIRMGILDVLNSYDDIDKFLDTQDNLGEDLLALKRVSETWNTQEPLDIGESATLYRFVRYALWKQNINRRMVKRRTLQNRNLCDDSDIVNWPLRDLLKLDNGTSQWASAAILMGNMERIENAPYKLKVTYDAKEHWEERRKKKKSWMAKCDETIGKQALAYVGWIGTGKLIFSPIQPEDYCFARAFDLISAEEGERRWSSLRGHETNRIDEMEKAIELAKKGVIKSKDHRVIQSLVMRHRSKLEVVHKDAVNKSWPKFWNFIEEVENEQER